MREENPLFMLQCLSEPVFASSSSFFHPKDQMSWDVGVLYNLFMTRENKSVLDVAVNQSNCVDGLEKQSI